MIVLGKLLGRTRAPGCTGQRFRAVRLPNRPRAPGSEPPTPTEILGNAGWRNVLTRYQGTGFRMNPDTKETEMERGTLRTGEVAARAGVNVQTLRIRALARAGVSIRNSVEKGPGGSQIMIDDPDGNPIELHQPPTE